MDWTRNIRKGVSGDDVMAAKQRLFALGYYADHITALARKTFGADTYEAVQRFQAQAGLPCDGVIGEETWAALFGQANEAEEAKPIAKAEPSTKALMLCSLALEHIGDVYVWGASGMTNLSDSAIKARDTEYARAIQFRDAQHKAGVTDLMAHDCSGFISYLMRQAGVWDNRRDCDGIWGYCAEVRRNELIAGDFLFRHESGNPGNKTHIGLYIGSGKVVHSKGRDVGVVHEGINKGGSGYWHVAGRCKLMAANDAPSAVV